jgi:hypothetical protein
VYSWRSTRNANLAEWKGLTTDFTDSTDERISVTSVLSVVHPKKNGGQKIWPPFVSIKMKESAPSVMAYSSFFSFGFLPSLLANCGSLAMNFSGSFSNAAGQFGQQK